MTNGDHYDLNLYKSSPINYHGRDGIFPTKILAFLNNWQKCTLKTIIYENLRPLVQNFA